jgi:predicted TIM-barrel fold metal-dependent hydrolase
MPDGTFGHKWDCMKAVGNMIAGGVLERYPGLNVVLAEAGVGWVPFFAQEFDYYQVSFPPSSGTAGLGRQRDIPLKPSEYIYRQVYGAFISDKVGCRLLPEYGLDNFMWSNDYPHGACIWPQATPFIAQDLGHLTPEDRAKVLWQNAARLYNDGQLPPPPDPVEAVKDVEAWNKVHWSE